MTDHQQIREALELAFEETDSCIVANKCQKALAALSRLEASAVPELSREDVVRLAREAGLCMANDEWPLMERFASLVRSVPSTGESHATHENQLGGMAEAPSPVRADQSPTAGMNIAQRILHVGGRNNAAGYVEFGSIQAVEALVRQVLRDLPESPELERLRADVKVYRDAWAAMLAVPVGEVKPVAWMNSAGQVVSAALVERYPEHKIEFDAPLYTTPPALPKGWRMVHEDRSDCHGPDWTDRDGEYLK